MPTLVADGILGDERGGAMDAKEMMSELADRIGKTGNVRAVFGEPIREGSSVIIPVARVAVRGGGGGGTETPAADEPAGGRLRPGGTGIGLGLNIVTAPVGYIQLGGEKPLFVPIVDKTRVVLAGLAALGLALWVIKVGMKLARK